MRALRLLHGDLPDLRAVPRRKRFPARSHRPHSRDAGKGRPAAREDSPPSRSLSFVPVVHDHLRREGGLCASDRYRAHLYRGQLSPPARRADAAAHDRRTAPLSAAFRPCFASGAACGIHSLASCRRAAQSGRACHRQPCRRRNSRARNLSGRRPQKTARGVAAELRPASARSQYQRGNDPPVAAARVRCGRCAQHRLLRRVAAAYGPQRSRQGSGAQNMSPPGARNWRAASMRSSSTPRAAARR